MKRKMGYFHHSHTQGVRAGNFPYEVLAIRGALFHSGLYLHGLNGTGSIRWE